MRGAWAGASVVEKGLAMKASPLAHLSKWRRLAPAVALLVVAFALVAGPVSQALAQDGPQAFAVYCETDKTLTLYKASDKPAAGTTYKGKAATKVFDVDENEDKFGESPFGAVADVVENVEIAVPGDAGKIAPLSTDHWFEDFENLQEVDGWENADTSKVANTSYMYYNADLSHGLSAPEFNTSSVTNMSYMFAFCSGLATPDFSSWNTSKVTDMTSMFQNCSSLSAPKLSGWNVTGVTSMQNMFYGCEALSSLDLSAWEPSKVTTMKQMFYQCTALTSLDFSGWNTPELKNLSYAFFQDAALTSLDFEGWSAPKISNLQSTFNQCSALTELDLSSWGASKVTDTSSTFLGCTSLATLDLSGIGANGKYGYTFDRCPALSKVTLGAGWSFGDTRSLLPEVAGKLWYKADADGNPTGDGYTPDELAAAWDGATMAGTWVLSDAPAAELEAFAVYSSTDNTLTLYKASNKPAEGGVYNNKAATHVFDIDEQATHFGASPFADVKDQVTKVIIAAPESADNKLTPKSMNRWFYNFTSLEQVDGWANADTSQVTDMSYMFYRCNLSKGLDAPNLNTSSVTDMSNMFYGCKGLSSATGPDLSSWDVSNVTDMSSMFRECTALQAPKTSGWNTSSVKNISDMFRGCSSIVTFDLTPWNLGNVEFANRMFSGCSALTTIALPDEDMASLTSANELFNGCSSLTTVNASSWVAPALTSASNMFYGCSALTSLDLSSLGAAALEDTDGMFCGCSALATLDLSGVGIAEKPIMSAMFTGCSALSKVTLGADWSFTDYRGALPSVEGKLWYKADAEGNPAGTGYAGDELATAWDGAAMAGTWVLSEPIAEPVVPEAFAIYDSSDKSLTIYKASDKPEVGDTYHGKTVSQVFGINEETEWFSTSPFITVQGSLRTVTFAEPEDPNNKLSPKSLNYWFKDFRQISSITGWENVDGSRVTRMENAFQGCEGLQEIDLSSVSFTGVANMSRLFEGCTGLKSANLSGLVGPNVTNISYMFYRCAALSDLDVSNWNTTGVTSLYGIFQDCAFLKELDLSSWDLAKVSNANWMFTDSAVEKVTLGAGFRFVVDGNDSYLPEAAGKLWYKLDAEGSPAGDGYASDELAEAWNGATMAGTWVLVDEIRPETSAFAVYSKDDKSLTIYKASDKPARNDTYNGKTVTYVFTIDETKTNYSSSPFSGYAREYESVVFAAPEYADDKIAPASMSNWFSGFEKAKSITGWENVDGSNIQSMSRAFEYCYALTSIDLSDLRLTKATDLSWLFSGCTSLETADLTGLVRSGVTTITYMFNNCSALTELNLLSWNTSGITENNADWMFNGVTSLEKVTLGDRFDFVAGYGVSLPDVAGKLWYLTDDNGDPTGTGYTGEDLAEAWDGDTMCGTWVLSEPIAESGPEAFAVYCEADKTLTIYKASDKPTEGEQYNGKAATRVFDIDETATSFSASPFADVAKDVTFVQIAAPESADDKLTPACTAHWFDGFVNLAQVADWQNADTSQVTDMSYMYRGCDLSNGFDAPDLKTGSVTTMSHMFDGCTGLAAPNLANFDMSSVTDMSYMFNGCTRLSATSISGWDVSSATNMSHMFAGCTSLPASFDLSGWTAPTALADASGMFDGCTSLTSLVFTDFGFAEGATTTDMLKGCTALITVKLGTGWSFEGGVRLPSAEGKLWFKDGNTEATGYDPDGLADAWTADMAGTWQLTDVPEPKPKPVELADLTASDSLTYGETLTVTFTPKSDDDVIASGTATLKLGDTVLATVSEPEADGSFSLSYNTADKGVALGEQTLTVTFESTGYEAATGTVETTLSAKALTVKVTSSLDKTWDGSDEVDGLAVELLGALEDDDVTVSATGAYASSDAGEQDVTLTLALSGDDAAWYTVSAPTDLTGTINAADIAGKLSLSGTPAFGETLTATYEPTSGEQVSYMWTRDGKVIDGATGSTYTLAKEDVGAQIAVVATASDANHTGSVTSDVVTVAKATQDAPAAPVVTATSHTTIEVEALADSSAGAKAEYSIDGGKTWQTETTFSGLEPETEYTVIARFQELDTHEASEVSEGTTVSTPAAPLPTFTVSVSAEGQGTVDGGGTYGQGTSVTVTATAAEGHHFVAWLVDGEQVSTETSYTFVVETDVALVAQFEQDEPDTPDPDDPDTPDNPDPEEPDKPADTKPGEQPKPEIPATGDAGAVAALVTALVGAGALGLGAYRRRS